MPYQTTTLAQLRSRLQDRWDGRPFWSNEDARLALNEGLRLWNAMTGTWKTRITLLTRPKDNFLPLTGTIVRRSRVEWQNIPLDLASVSEMDGAYPSWIGQHTASGGSIPTQPKIWIPISLNLIAIWPADAGGSAAGGFNSVQVDGVAATPILSVDGDFVDVGDEMHSILIDYAFHVASFKAGTSTLDSTMEARKRFIKAAAKHNNQLAASEPFRAMIGLDTSMSTHPVAKQ